MKVEQIYDECLAHASYIIISENEAAVIDPARNPAPYLKYLEQHNAKLKGIFETHPHADFVSSHTELSRKTGAPVYVCSLVNPDYKFTPFDDGMEVKIGKVKLESIYTPGHSPDSISILIYNESGKPEALATGDTLFVGDVGRPDLREEAGSLTKTKDELARMMFDTIRKKLFNIPDDVIVFPAHGPGSLCGKTTSKERHTSIGKEKKTNYAFNIKDEDEFVNELLKDQSFIPKYFAHAVEMNRRGAQDFSDSIKDIKLISSDNIPQGSLIIDTRTKEKFSSGHSKGAINITANKKFETWLGTLVSPEESFVLITDDGYNIDSLKERTAKIGYEKNLKGIIQMPPNGDETLQNFSEEQFKNNQSAFTVIDVRNNSELKSGKVFDTAIHIPLPELRERLDEIPEHKPIVVHCAGGSRSAIAASLMKAKLNVPVYDMGDSVKKYFK